MKKNTIASIIMVSGFLMSASIVSAVQNFSTDLKIGTQGGDVPALQSLLIQVGYHIPSIEDGSASKGYFGRETQNAVRQYQAAKSIPSTGFVGPLTRASLNSLSGAVTSILSPVMSSTSTSQSMPIITTITTPGIGGSLALTLQSTPANGTSISKGQSADIANYKVQAGSSDMKLNSIALDVNNRLWLYAQSVSIMDGSTIVGQVNNLMSNNFTEITAGSNYRITIPTSLIIAKASIKYLIVHIVMLPISDRSSGTLSITRFETRALDGTGVNDTETLSSTRTFSYTGNNNGQVIVTQDPQSPPNMTATISTAATTDNIVLGVADFNSQGKDGIMRSVTLYMNANFNLSSIALTTLLADVKIQSGSLIYSADSIGGVSSYVPGYGVPVTFTNMAIPLPKDTLVPVAIMVKVNQDVNHTLDTASASSTLVASGTAGGTDNNPVIEDASHNTVAINTAPLVTSDITFVASNSNMDYTAPVIAKLGAPVLTGLTTNIYPVTFGFSITAGDNTLYVSADPNQALSTSSTGLPNNTSATLPMGGVTATPSNIAGDTNISSISGYYVIPAGSTRSFMYSGSISNTGGTSGLKTFQINGIKYGTSTGSLTLNTLVYYNYGALKVTPTF